MEPQALNISSICIYTFLSHHHRYLFPAYGAQGAQLVEGAGVGGAQSGHTAEGDQPSLPVLLHGPGQNVPGKRELQVRLQQPHPHPSQQPRSLHAGVSLLGAVAHQAGYDGGVLLLFDSPGPGLLCCLNKDLC